MFERRCRFASAVEFDLDNSAVCQVSPTFMIFRTNTFGQRVYIVLRGVAVIDPYFLHAAIRRGQDALDFLADEWILDIVRVPSHPDLMDR